MDSRIQLLKSFAKPSSEICNTYYSKNAKTWQKADKSFVSEADIKVNDFLLSQIQSHFAEDAILSEESPDDAKRFTAEYTWIIDPIDGTSEFIAGSPEFCVMVCLLHKNSPVYAMVAIPQENKAYFGGPSKNLIELDLLSKKETQLFPKEHNSNTLIISKSRAAKEISVFAEECNLTTFSCGSAGVKVCRILQGKADYYIHINKIAEWDTAAPDCLLKSWGRGLTDLDGEELKYNKSSFYHPRFFYLNQLNLLQSAQKFFQLN